MTVSVRAMGKSVSKPYIIDRQTSNLSFLKTSLDLHRLGIKECDFFLRLYNPSLQGVDPFSPFLTPEQKRAIAVECTINPWYYLREVSLIPDQGAEAIRFQLHRGNLALVFLFLSGIDSYTVMPRQKGKTQSAIAILCWAFLFGTSNSDIMFLNKSMEDAVTNLERLKRQRELLPAYLQSRELVEDGKLIKGQDNVKTIVNPVVKNKITVKPKATSREAAKNLGRGNSQPIQFMDEVEFTSFIHEIILASAPAFGKAASNAKRNKAVHGRILISTPGDLDDSPTQEALKIIETTCPWSELMYDMNKRELKEYLDANTGNNPCPIVYVEYQYTQLGEGQEWFNNQCALLLYDKIAIRREILLQRVNGSNNSPFDMQDLMAITDSKRRPIREEIIMGKYKLDLYSEIDKRKLVCIAIDTSTGIGQDSNAITVIDPHTKKPVAEFACKYMSSVDLRKFVYILATKYYPNCFIVPERNMGGYALVDELLETDIGYKIYFENVSNIESYMDDRVDTQGFMKAEAMQRKVRGVQTTGKSREMMMKILNTHVKDHKDTFVTQNIISDVNNLVLTSGGKVEAAKGKHDDSIMSFLIGLYVIYYGKNLARFGFVPGLTDEDKQRMNSGIHQWQEESILDHFEEQVNQGSMSKEFADGFKTGQKSDLESYNEYENLIVATRARMDRMHDPYEVNQTVNMGSGAEGDMYANRGSIPGSFFTDINSF